jgi:hypothetical protein
MSTSVVGTPNSALNPNDTANPLTPTQKVELTVGLRVAELQAALAVAAAHPAHCTCAVCVDSQAWRTILLG